MRLHLDFEVTDLEAETQRALQLGLSWRPTNRKRTCGSCSTLPGTPSVSTPVEDARLSATCFIALGLRPGQALV
jgi:hypothetical protein